MMPYVIVVVASVGGQGKTLVAELVTVLLRSLGHKVQVFSADVQSKLAAKLRDVVNLDIGALDLASADDPMALLRCLAPFSEAVAGSAQDPHTIVLDTAATWDSTILRYLRDVRLDECVTSAGGQLILAFVTTSNGDAMRSMVTSTVFAREALPKAKVAWFLNERLGPAMPADFDPHLGDLQPKQFAKMRADIAEIRLPRMHDRIWQPVDRKALDFLKVVTADPADLARLWVEHDGRALDRLSAAVVQRQIAAWVARMMEETAAALHFQRAQ
jgi:hypothetical protein